MVPLRGKPLLEHSIQRLRREGFDHFLLAAGFKAGVIRDYFAAHCLGVRIEVIEETSPLGTAGPLRLLAPHLAENFLVLYGDVFIDFAVGELWDAHLGSGAAATLLVRPSDHPWDSDLVELDEAGSVTGFLPAKEPRVRPRNVANAAVYAVSRELVPLVEPDRPSDFIRDLFPKALAAGHCLRGHFFSEDGFLKDMGTPERLEKVERYLEERDWIEAARRATTAAGDTLAGINTVFLDRDGVINEDTDLIDRPERLELLPGVGEAIAALNRAGKELIVVTNQPVIARGLCTGETLEAIHQRMRHLLAQSGARLDAIYFCPHHPESHHAGGVTALRVACACRKPQPGMILRAVRERQVDLCSAILIGDREVDRLAAHRAGIRFLAVGNHPFKRLAPGQRFLSLCEVARALCAV